MRPLPRSLLVVAVISAALAFCATAGAANVTIGPTLTSGTWYPEACGPSPTCTAANYELGTSGTTLTSPVRGAVVSFSVLGGSTPGTYRLRTVQPLGAPYSWIFKDEDPAVTVVPNAGIQSYGAALPILAGDTVALTMSNGASLSYLEGTGNSSYWEVEPPEKGHTTSVPESGFVLGFDAEIQPAPTIAALGTTSGPPAATPVTITGTDLEGATSVTFGGNAATITADSETQITAVVPPIAVPAVASSASSTEVVPVKVTTVAGTATSPQQFTYVLPPSTPLGRLQCVVPKLTGRTLAAAKKALTKAHCRLGKVKKLGGATPKSGKVSRQGSKPGAKLAYGSKVAVTLKPAKPAGTKHKKR
jgi:hypothetical protein